MDRNRSPPFKNTERRSFTTTTAAGAGAPSVPSPRVVRVSFTDFDATDSSSDDGDYHQAKRQCRRPRVKKHVTQIRIEMGREKIDRSRSDSKQRIVKPSPVGGEEKQSPVGERKFRGVRRRQWGRWAAEIGDPEKRKRIWLGTYNTAEEAAMVYDTAAIRLRGPHALTNFARPPPPPPPPPPPSLPTPPPPPPVDVDFLAATSSGRESEKEESRSNSPSLCSPTSVLRFHLPEETEQETGKFPEMVEKREYDDRKPAGELDSPGEDDSCLILDPMVFGGDLFTGFEPAKTTFFFGSTSQRDVVFDDFDDFSDALDDQFGIVSSNRDVLMG